MKKKILLSLAGSLILIIGAAIILPIVFKDDIRKAIDEQIAKTINADVVYTPEKFSVSLFRDFPNLTVETGPLGIFNRAPFEGQYLFATENLSVEVDLWEVIFGDKVSISGITLNTPDINVRVLADGRANYDITYPSTDTVTTADTSKFSFSINRWEIINGRLDYDDATIPYAMKLTGLQHTGNGDFTESVFDLVTESTADSLTVVFDGVEYLTNKHAQVDAVISVSEDFSKFTFRENTARLNDFAFGFDGWFKMNETSYDMDITWQTKENTFKSLLSLVPGMYTSDFKGIDASGNVKLGGFARGTFSDTQLPAFRLEMMVSEGLFRYPDLPEAVRNIAMDLLVDNKDGIINNTRVDLKKLHLEFGNNPVDARMVIENLRDYRMDGNVKARLDLGALSKMFPMEGMTLKGMFSLDASAKGIYDSVRQIIPAVSASMALSNGYARTKDLPFAAEGVEAAATVVNTSGKMTETAIDLSKLKMKLDGETFEATMSLRNLADYTWKAAAKGGIDLGKLTSIFPVEGMTLAGKVNADVQTAGKYSDLEAGRYDKLPTSGKATLTGFMMTSTDLPYAVGISEADLSLDPSTLSLNKFESTVGKSDFSGTGKISGYLGFAMGGDELMHGSVSFRSKLIDLNEFMTEGEEATATDTASFGVIPVPANLDLQFSLDADRIRMMDLELSEAMGKVLLKEGQAKLSGVRFNLLGGGFTMNGTYDPRKIDRPLYDFDMGISKLSIRAAAENFSLVKKFAPIAGVAKGNFSMNFRIAGAMDDHLSPDASSVNANGLITIHEAGVSGSKAIGAITSLTRLKDTEQVTLKDVKVSATVTDGRLAVKPFDVRIGNFVTTVSGSSGLNGSLDYGLRMMVPPSMLGSQVTGLLTQAGVTASAKEDVPLNIRLGGTFSSPKAELVTTAQQEQVKAALTAKAEEKGKEVLKEALTGTSAKQIVGNLLGKDTTKKDSAAKAAPVQKLLEDKLKGLLKKKKKN